MVQTDYTDYDDLSVDDLEARLDSDAASMQPTVANRLLNYEQAHKDRKTAVDALKAAHDEANPDAEYGLPDFEGEMFPDDAKAVADPAEADEPDIESDDAEERAKALEDVDTPPSPAEQAAERLASEHYDHTSNALYPEGRVPDARNLPSVKVRIAQPQGVGGGRVARMWFDSNNETRRVKRTKRVDEAIDNGKLIVVNHDQTFGDAEASATDDAQSQRRRRR